MLPHALKVEQFAAYPIEARELVVQNLQMLRELPISFLPSLLREITDYDFKFPAERASIERELSALKALSPAQFQQWFQPFAQISLSPKLESFDWVNQPGQFIEQQSAHLWTTHQQDAFRKAATEYGDRLRAAIVVEPLAVNRLGIAVIGQGVSSYEAPLFRYLREHGTHFKRINPENGLGLLLSGVTARAQKYSIPYGHWYVDGGEAVAHSPLLTSISYQTLEPVRATLLRKMQAEIGQAGMGPEQLRSYLARLTPADLGMDMKGDPVLDRFKIKVLTEGSGTQIFSTTFAQWTARESLRRAQPLTLLVRFAPRQQQKPMNEMLSGDQAKPSLDYVGSLIDADMGSYYHWLNQQRLQGSEWSAFVVWFEGHNQAFAIGPSIPRGTESESAADLSELFSWAAS